LGGAAAGLAAAVLPKRSARLLPAALVDEGFTTLLTSVLNSEKSKFYRRQSYALLVPVPVRSGTVPVRKISMPAVLRSLSQRSRNIFSVDEADAEVSIAAPAMSRPTVAKSFRISI
jgi:hypothetical protein